MKLKLFPEPRPASLATLSQAVPLWTPLHTGLTGFPLLTIRTGVKIPPPTRAHLRVSLLLFWASVFMVMGDVRPWVVIEGVGYARPVVGLVMGI